MLRPLRSQGTVIVTVSRVCVVVYKAGSLTSSLVRAFPLFVSGFLYFHEAEVLGLKNHHLSITQP